MSKREDPKPTPTQPTLLRVTARDDRARGISMQSKVRKSRLRNKLFGNSDEQQLKIGRFRILDSIGSGGMGEIFSAYDERLDRKVAIKLVHQNHSRAMRAQARLLREAQALAQLSHPNVVQVYEVGTADGQLFIAMEYIRGTTLRRWLEDKDRDSDKDNDNAKDNNNAKDSDNDNNKSDVWQGRQRVVAILNQFVAIGQGLKAAHDVGVVHRDFKPENVLIGTDGRPRVVDFGLARALDDADSDAQETVSDATYDQTGPRATRFSDGTPRPQPIVTTPKLRRAALALTSDGQVMGTPGYMSPEQYWAERELDSRSDQFSFCVALYEALYRQRPFNGRSQPELKRATTNGDILPAPRDSDVPAAVQAALLRGLSPHPDDRFPSMAELIEAITPAQPQTSRRWWLAAAAAAAVTGGAMQIFGGLEDPCAQAGDAIVRTWNEPRAEQISAHFAASKLPYAELTWRSIAERIDSYTVRWRHSSAASCEATNVEKTQTDSAHQRRSLCLERARRDLDVLLVEFEHADSAIIQNALQAMSALRDLDQCDNPELLNSPMSLPKRADESLVHDIRAQLMQARTRIAVEDHEAALTFAQAAVPRAEASDYPPVHAEALAVLGRIHARSGDNEEERKAGEALMIRASNLAVAQHHDELDAQIWTSLGMLGISHHPLDEISRRADRAQAAIARIDNPASLHANLLRLRAEIARRDRRYRDAEEYLQRALKSLPDDASASERGDYQVALGHILRLQGRYDRAYEYFQRAFVATSEAMKNENHPATLYSREGLARIHRSRGEFDLAVAQLNSVLRTYIQTFGPNHSNVGRTEMTLSDVERDRGNWPRARYHAQKAREIYQTAYEENHYRRAEPHVRLGAIAFFEEEFDKAAEHYRSAIEIEQQQKQPNPGKLGGYYANLAEARLAQGTLDDADAALAQADTYLTAAGPRYERPYAPFITRLRGQLALAHLQLPVAIGELERAVVMYEARDATALELADAYWALAQALAAQDPKSPRASKLALAAQAHYAEHGADQPGWARTHHAAITTFLK
ncbi:MAG: hypothetical protein Tsb0020_15520 [Haliangiales bacterium]